MSNLFESIFKDGATPKTFIICLLFGLLLGAIFSVMCHYKTRSSKSFFVATALMPVTVAMVILLVNGNIGVGVAVAGAFSLVRFRSAPGTAKEISIIFIAMATGLALGIGYVAYASIFTVLSGVVLMFCSHFRFWEVNGNSLEKILKITIPENLNYQSVFGDIFDEYLDRCELLKVRTTNMGSMFRLTYSIKLKSNDIQKEFIDQIRCRNGNLEVSLEKDYNLVEEL